MAVLTALVPAPARAQIVEAMLDKLTSGSLMGSGESNGTFDALHLRYEKDWVEHCRLWKSIKDGVLRNNCGMLPVGELVAKLASMGIAADGIPLYVAVQSEQLPDDSVMVALRSSFNVITKDDLLPRFPSGQVAKFSREEAALLEYFVCLRARTFIGNSVSAFSSLLIMERRAVGNVATWYNGGNIPLESMLPYIRMPWIFILIEDFMEVVHRGRC